MSTSISVRKSYLILQNYIFFHISKSQSSSLEMHLFCLMELLFSFYYKCCGWSSNTIWSCVQRNYTGAEQVLRLAQQPQKGNHVLICQIYQDCCSPKMYCFSRKIKGRWVHLKDSDFILDYIAFKERSIRSFKNYRLLCLNYQYFMQFVAGEMHIQTRPPLLSLFSFRQLFGCRCHSHIKSIEPNVITH